MKIRLATLIAFVFVAACSESPAPDAGSSQAATAPAVRDSGAPAAASTTNSPAPAAQPERIELAQAETGGADLEAAGYVEGEHYVLISPAQPTSATGPDQVEVAEFFMYSCIHCYNFEPYVEEWLGGKADYVNFVRVPTVWNAAVRMHAQAFYAAAALGKGDEMHTPFFREMHVTGNYLTSPGDMEDFFARFDVSSDEFSSAFESFAVNTSLRQADELARRYRVDSTPTVVVNGKYRTNASMAGGYPELLELIDALAAAEYDAM